MDTPPNCTLHSCSVRLIKYGIQHYNTYNEIILGLYAGFASEALIERCICVGIMVLMLVADNMTSTYIYSTVSASTCTSSAHKNTSKIYYIAVKYTVIQKKINIENYMYSNNGSKFECVNSHG